MPNETIDEITRASLREIVRGAPAKVQLCTTVDGDGVEHTFTFREVADHYDALEKAYQQALREAAKEKRLATGNKQAQVTSIEADIIYNAMRTERTQLLDGMVADAVGAMPACEVCGARHVYTGRRIEIAHDPARHAPRGAYIGEEPLRRPRRVREDD